MKTMCLKNFLVMLILCLVCFGCVTEYALGVGRYDTQFTIKYFYSDGSEVNYDDYLLLEDKEKKLLTQEISSENGGRHWWGYIALPLMMPVTLSLDGLGYGLTYSIDILAHIVGIFDRILEFVNGILWGKK